MSKKNKAVHDSGDAPKEAASEATKVPHRYPLELVANLAVQLVQHSNYDGAAKSAVALLDACTDVLEGRGKPPAGIVRPPAPRRVRLQKEEPTDMEWDKFLQLLTRRERRERAAQKINDFFKFDVRRAKAVNEALPYAGVNRVAETMWRHFIDRMPESTDVERDARIKELQELGGTRVSLITGEKRPYIVARGMVEIYQNRYAEWQEYERHRKAVLNGSVAVGKGKKRGRPKKNAEK